jgi:predicted RecA/RadA family phage recombinase
MAQTLEAMMYQGSQLPRYDYTPSGAAIANGQIVNMGSGMTGVCTSPEGIADGVLGSLASDGIFKVKKAVSGGVTFARGVKVGWDDTDNTAVAAGTGDWDIGTCVEAAADAGDHVKVHINRDFTDAIA